LPVTSHGQLSRHAWSGTHRQESLGSPGISRAISRDELDERRTVHSKPHLDGISMARPSHQPSHGLGVAGVSLVSHWRNASVTCTRTVAIQSLHPHCTPMATAALAPVSLQASPCYTLAPLGSDAYHALLLSPLVSPYAHVHHAHVTIHAGHTPSPTPQPWLLTSPGSSLRSSQVDSL